MNIPLAILEYCLLFVGLSLLIFYGFPKLNAFDSKISSPIKSLILVLIILAFNSLLSVSTDNFMFELTPEKKCDGGPYMYSSDPARQALCSKFSSTDLSRYECPAGLYHGRPVWWDGATNDTMSNSNWQNDTCGKINNTVNDPQVL